MWSEKGLTFPWGARNGHEDKKCIFGFLEIVFKNLWGWFPASSAWTHPRWLLRGHQ